MRTTISNTDLDFPALSTGNFVSAIETSFASGIGWLITFCADRGGNYVGFYFQINKTN